LLLLLRRSGRVVRRHVRQCPFPLIGASADS